MKSIIGRKYVPCDNSYNVNITSSSDYPYKNNRVLLAACPANNEQINTCIIVSDPFYAKVKGCDGNIYIENLIAVDFENNTILTLYYECQILPE